MGKSNPDPRKEAPQQPPIQSSTPISPMVDHSFTLQAIMELQKSVGQLTEAVNTTRLALEKQNQQLGKIEEKVSSITHKLYAAGVVLAIALAMGGFLLNKSWDKALDLLADQIKSSPSRP
jgi:hypothetical protein